MDDAPSGASDAVILVGAITVLTAPALHQRLLAHLAAGGAYALDGAQVDRVDAAGAQLLYAFRAEAAHHQATARWTAVSQPLLEGARALGMAACLGLSEEGSSWQR